MPEEPLTAKDPEKGDPDRGIPPVVAAQQPPPEGANAQEPAKDPQKGDPDRGIPPLPENVSPAQVASGGGLPTVAPEHEEGEEHRRKKSD